MKKRITGVDFDTLYESCIDIEKDILKKFSDKETFPQASKRIGDISINRLYNGSLKPSEFYCDSLIGVLVPYYNVFEYKTQELNSVLEQIISMFSSYFSPQKGTYHISSWLIVLRNNERLGEHYHRIVEERSWYGFLWVNNEDKTNNGLLDLNETTGETHSVEKYTGDDCRITIAFDIFTCPVSGSIPFVVE